jgi:hypothetical protein
VCARIYYTCVRTHVKPRSNAAGTVLEAPARITPSLV